jgi:NAD(P)-dependent dehydrogenase (short-subunit alcohol dehydrogenase family)
MTEPHDRIALVTGAGSGVGRAAARALVADGWRVVFSGRRLGALQDSIALCEDPFDDIESRALAVPADVSRPEAVAALFDVVRARFGRLDFLFNSAGTGPPATPLEDIPYEQWRATLDTNLTGSFLCTQEAFRMMKAQAPRGGRIVHNAAFGAHAQRALSLATVATRHAMAGFTQASAQDGRAHGIAVGQLDFGDAAADGRVDPQEAARAVLHLANLPPGVNVLAMRVTAT